MSCKNPCRDYIFGGCGNSDCHSYCHQAPQFYKKYNTIDKLKTREKEIELQIEKETETHEKELLKTLKNKYENKI